MVKLTKRKGFNFLRSYLDVYNLLTTDKDKVDLIECIFNKQFYGIEPNTDELSPMCAMAYVSQKHSLDKSVKGFEDKTGNKLIPLEHTFEAKSNTFEDSFEQVQEEEEEKEKGKEKEQVKEQQANSIEFSVEDLEVESEEINNQLTIIDEIKERKNIPLKKETYSLDVKTCYLSCLKYFDQHLHPKDENNWLEVIDKLNRIDKIPFETIEDITKWAREDNFWKTNFLSLTKLRKKNPDKLMYIIVFNEKRKNGKQNSSSAEEHIKRMQNSNDSVDEFLRQQ